MRDSAVSETDASGSWDPYEVWLTRVKRPRDGQTVAAPPAPRAIKVPTDLSETARMRALTLPAG